MKIVRGIILKEELEKINDISLNGGYFLNMNFDKIKNKLNIEEAAVVATAFDRVCENIEEPKRSYVRCELDRWLSATNEIAIDSYDEIKTVRNYIEFIFDITAAKQNSIFFSDEFGDETDSCRGMAESGETFFSKGDIFDITIGSILVAKANSKIFIVTDITDKEVTAISLYDEKSLLTIESLPVFINLNLTYKFRGFGYDVNRGKYLSFNMKENVDRDFLDLMGLLNDKNFEKEAICKVILEDMRRDSEWSAKFLITTSNAIKKAFNRSVFMSDLIRLKDGSVILKGDMVVLKDLKQKYSIVVKEITKSSITVESIVKYQNSFTKEYSIEDFENNIVLLNDYADVSDEIKKPLLYAARGIVLTEKNNASFLDLVYGKELKLSQRTIKEIVKEILLEIKDSVIDVNSFNIFEKEICQYELLVEKDKFHKVMRTSIWRYSVLNNIIQNCSSTARLDKKFIKTKEGFYYEDASMVAMKNHSGVFELLISNISKNGIVVEERILGRFRQLFANLEEFDKMRWTEPEVNCLVEYYEKNSMYLNSIELDYIRHTFSVISRDANLRKLNLDRFREKIHSEIRANTLHFIKEATKKDYMEILLGDNQIRNIFAQSLSVKENIKEFLKLDLDISLDSRDWAGPRLTLNTKEAVFKLSTDNSVICSLEDVVVELTMCKKIYTEDVPTTYSKEYHAELIPYINSILESEVSIEVNNSVEINTTAEICDSNEETILNDNFELNKSKEVTVACQYELESEKVTKIPLKNLKCKIMSTLLNAQTGKNETLVCEKVVLEDEIIFERTYEELDTQWLSNEVVDAIEQSSAIIGVVEKDLDITTSKGIDNIECKLQKNNLMEIVEYIYEKAQLSYVLSVPRLKLTSMIKKDFRDFNIDTIGVILLKSSFEITKENEKEIIPLLKIIEGIEQKMSEMAGQTDMFAML